MKRNKEGSSTHETKLIDGERHPGIGYEGRVYGIYILHLYRHLFEAPNRSVSCASPHRNGSQNKISGAYFDRTFARRAELAATRRELGTSPHWSSTGAVPALKEALSKQRSPADVTGARDATLGGWGPWMERCCGNIRSIEASSLGSPPGFRLVLTQQLPLQQTARGSRDPGTHLAHLAGGRRTAPAPRKQVGGVT